MTLKRSQLHRRTPLNRSPWNRKPADHARLRRQRKALKPKRATVSKLSQWSKAVRANAVDGMCERCRMREGQHAHHVAPRSRRPDLRLVVSNGRWVCWLCHDWIHNNPKESTAEGWLSDEPYERKQVSRVNAEQEEAVRDEERPELTGQYLYLAHLPGSDSYKVGITGDLEQRLKGLRHVFGKDLYFLQAWGPSAICFMVENQLLKDLGVRRFKHPARRGGYTEWFNLSGMDVAVLRRSIDTFVAELETKHGLRGLAA